MPENIKQSCWYRLSIAKHSIRVHDKDNWYEIVNFNLSTKVKLVKQAVTICTCMISQVLHEMEKLWPVISEYLKLLEVHRPDYKWFQISLYFLYTCETSLMVSFSNVLKICLCSLGRCFWYFTMNHYCGSWLDMCMLY